MILTVGVNSKSIALLVKTELSGYILYMRRYTMKEISGETGLTSDTLRYYEKDGLLSDIIRLPNGHRQYTTHDLEWLKFVLCLRSTGMPLKKIKEYKELMNQGDKTTCDRKELLITQRENIVKEIQVLGEALKRIDWKIEYYATVEENL